MFYVLSVFLVLSCSVKAGDKDDLAQVPSSKVTPPGGPAFEMSDVLYVSGCYAYTKTENGLRKDHIFNVMEPGVVYECDNVVCVRDEKKLYVLNKVTDKLKEYDCSVFPTASASAASQESLSSSGSSSSASTASCASSSAALDQ